ncbi:MAG: DUF4402 domain-containing protein [Pseudomonadota bacterium]
MAVNAALAALIAGGSSAVSAASADGSATATVIEPVSVTETTPLAFGSLAVGAGGGDVIIDTAGTATSSGDVELISSSTTSQATFTITGEPDAAITVSLDGTGAQLDDGTPGGDGTPMQLGGLTDSGLPATLTGGSVTFDVGATLTVNANQAPGAYSTATGDGSPYSVTVNYQ